MDDLISRKALLDIVGKIPLSWEYGQAISDVYDIIKTMPTRTLDDLRPKGRWENPHKPRCSNCKKPARRDSSGGLLPVCLYCLADMRGGGEDG